MSFVNSYRFTPSGGGIPETDLAWWYQFDNASKITEDGSNIQEILDNEWDFSATPIVNDPVYSSANGRTEFNFGSSEALKSEILDDTSAPNSNTTAITSGFMAMVIELDSLTASRWLSGVALRSYSSPFSQNVYGNFFGVSSGGFKLMYRGRLTSQSATFLNIDGTTALVTGQKYLLQIYVPPTGGTYYEIDGVAQNNDATGDRFAGVLDVGAGSTLRWSVDMGVVTGSGSYTYSGSHKIYETIGYQNFDQTTYDDVEAYLKSKYSIA